MISTYPTKRNRFLILLLAFVFAVLPVITRSQTTILSTESGTNYTGSSGLITSAGVITFVIQNTNTFPVTLKKVNARLLPSLNNTIPRLWYSASSLSDVPTVAPTVWTVIASGSAVPVPAAGYYTVLDNIGFTVPANTEYRFALETSRGIAYTNANANPDPSVFTANGILLKVGDAQSGGINVGYGGAMPTPASTPARFFTGGVTLCTSSINAGIPSVTPDTALCSTDSITLRVTGGNINDAADWVWHTDSCNGPVAGKGTAIRLKPASSTTYYVRGEGGCARSNGPCASVGVLVKQAPITPVIGTPAPVCKETVATLSIAPFVSGTTPIPDTVTISAAVSAVNIPDNAAAGLTSSLIVPELPAGSQVTGMDVVLNLAHPNPGNMIINLQAPNGVVANLYKYNGGNFTGSGGGADAGWYDAVTGAAGTLPYNIIGTPYRYDAGSVFAPDLLNTVVAGPAIQNPDNFVSTAESLPALYTAPNGTWTLALADGVAGDIGTLNSWSIQIRYNRFEQLRASPAVWTPGNNLYVDEAATVPYDGSTPRLQVFALPSATTTYTATSILNGCYSVPVATTVTVVDPINITIPPADTAICTPGNVYFKVTAEGASPAYQWVLNNGTEIITLTDDDHYTGTTTDSLTVAGIPASWNNYKYACVVTGFDPCVSSDTSQYAILTAYPTPVVTLGLPATSPTALLPGMTDTLKVAATPAAEHYTWYRDNNVLTGEQENTVSVTVATTGAYKATITDINGCSNTSNTVTIRDSVSSKLFVYPNPATGGRFAVSYFNPASGSGQRALTVYDAKGALVFNKTYSLTGAYYRMEVNLPQYSSGIYMINLLDGAGKRIATGKVLVR